MINWSGIYSQRMAAIGSIFAARSAGSKDAALAIAARTRIETAKTQGSRVDVPYKKLARARDASNAANKPAAVPTKATAAFWANTIPATCALRAPRAIRIPISLVRRAVE